MGEQRSLAEERRKLISRKEVRRVPEDVMRLRIELEKVLRE